MIVGAPCPASHTQHAIPEPPESRIIDCPKCGRPVTVRLNGNIARHRVDETPGTRLHDERRRHYREIGIR